MLYKHVVPVLTSLGLAGERRMKSSLFFVAVAKRGEDFPDAAGLCKTTGLLHQVNVWL